jgi:hypothetical protein
MESSEKIYLPGKKAASFLHVREMGIDSMVGQKSPYQDRREGAF